MNWRRTSDGYTLVESLASLTLLGLVSLLLVVGLQAAHVRLARLDRADVGEIEAAQDMLRARLEQATPRTVLDTGTAQIDFDGRNDQLDFTAPPPQAHGPDAPYHYRLYLSGGGDLKLDAASDVALDQTKPASSVVLVHGVGSLDVAYFGADTQGASPGWTSHWQQQPLLPRLVRVRLAFPAQDPRTWPTLLIRPAATIDSACIIDFNSGACQGRT
ncbi:MAG TPA: hypothetical protein VFE13_17630 [Caulobacteraceae bacterium]|jgi:general secretion pathway protein J|nr:hypothetical protein [Caulobacteraceae bacterium]